MRTFSTRPSVSLRRAERRNAHGVRCSRDQRCAPVSSDSIGLTGVRRPWRAKIHRGATYLLIYIYIGVTYRPCPSSHGSVSTRSLPFAT